MTVIIQVEAKKQSPSQQTQNICITFVQRRLSIFDVGPAMYKWYTNGFFCLLGLLCQVVIGHARHGRVVCRSQGIITQTGNNEFLPL